MVVRLRDRVAVPLMAFHAERVAAHDTAICGRAVARHPIHQGRTEVGVEQLVVVADVNNASVHRMSVAVGGVTFAHNPLVPISERRGSILGADEPGPRAFARRLIKMAVNYYVAQLRISRWSG